MEHHHFAALSPDVIVNALAEHGIQLRSGLLALNSYENRVYQYLTEEGQRHVVKFYRPERWSRDQIEEEHSFTAQLAEHELPVVPALTLHGQRLLTYQGYHFSVFPSVGGRNCEIDNLDHLEWIGRLMGRFHRVSCQREFSFRPALTVERFLTIPRQTLAQARIIPDYLHEAFFAILDPLITLTEQRVKQSRYTRIRLHGDCHPGNILWRDGPTFVDLDDCQMGPAIQDLWMLLSGDRQQQQLQLSCLLEGYEEFHSFDTQEVSLIEPLRAMRMVHYMAWLNDRWQDPAFPRAFPWFAEARYWESQILALKEQYAALQEPPLQVL